MIIEKKTNSDITLYKKLFKRAKETSLKKEIKKRAREYLSFGEYRLFLKKVK